MKPSETSAACEPISASRAVDSSSVGASGFSQSTGFPAATQARMNSGWVASCEAINTASTSLSVIN